MNHCITFYNKEVQIMRRVDFIVGARDFKTLKAEQFMEDRVFAYQAEDDGETLAQAMTEGGFGSVPIVDQKRHLLGIVSELDLLRALKEEKHLASVKAGDLMTPNPVTVSAETLAMDIIQLLEAKHLIRMPVVDEQGQLLGVVARRDVLLGYLNAIRVTRIF
jgi:CBS domain-containing protein